jgi:hypothetical protein
MLSKIVFLNVTAYVVKISVFKCSHICVYGRQIIVRMLCSPIYTSFTHMQVYVVYITTTKFLIPNKLG